MFNSNDPEFQKKNHAATLKSRKTMRDVIETAIFLQNREKKGANLCCQLCTASTSPSHTGNKKNECSFCKKSSDGEYCDDCAKKYGLCKKCGGLQDIHQQITDLLESAKMGVLIQTNKIKYCISLAANFQKDTNKEQRLSRLMCPTCFYQHRLAMNSFHYRNCECCGVNVAYSTSSTNTYCDDCAKTLDCCIRCAGSLHP